MKCEYCRTIEIGEYIENKDKSKTSRFFDNAKIMPCCRAEICFDCYLKIKEKGKCIFCGSKLQEQK